MKELDVILRASQHMRRADALAMLEAQIEHLKAYERVLEKALRLLDPTEDRRAN